MDDGRRTKIGHKNSPCVFGSGELKMHDMHLGRFSVKFKFSFD